jgi:hypothetical protein
MNPTGRTTWILAPSWLGELALGPDQRIVAMAEALRAAGHRVALGLVECNRRLPDGIEFVPLDPAIASIRPGDPVVLQPGLRMRQLWSLLRRGIPFHVDFFNVISSESLDHFPRHYPPRKAAVLGRRMCFREAMLARHARRIYVSNGGQMSFLAGLVAPKSAARASDLPARCIEVPMGVPDLPMRGEGRFPYPDALRERPIFLWGGGIWSWMDPRPLLSAFRILQERGSDAALFFIAGRNHSANRDEDRPMRDAREFAESIGAAGKSVFFNDQRATPADLPDYLSHCRAGILFNGPTLESRQSWRTRLLDLLWAGKPALVAGRDPLSDRMKDAGAAWDMGQSPERIADAIQEFLTRDTAAMEESALRLGQSLTWSRVLAPFVESMGEPGAFEGAGEPYGLLDIGRYWIA